MIKINLRKDFKQMEFLERKLAERVEFSVKDAAQALKDDIRSNWSPVAPSSEGNSPLWLRAT